MTAPEADRLERRIVVGVLVGVLLYAAMALIGDVQALGNALWEFPKSVFFGALALSVVNYAIRWCKWHFYLYVLECDVDIGTSVLVFLSGLTMSITPGKLGEVLKSILLKRSHGFPIEHTAPIVFAERLTDLLGLFVIAAMGIGFFDFGRWAFLGVLAVIASGMLLLTWDRAVTAGLDLLARVPFGARLRPRLDEAYLSTRRLIGRRSLLVATGLSVLSWSMEALAFYWILITLAPSVAPLLAGFIYSMTTILGAVSFLPGGLGVTEGSMIGALMLFDVFADEVGAMTATYLIRISTLWFAVAIGVVGLAWFERRTKRLPV